MNRKTLLLVSTDEEYNLNIETKLALQLSSSVVLEIISDILYLEEYQKKPRKVNLLIVEEKSAPQISQNLQAEKVLILSEDTILRSDNRISKFGGAQAIIRNLPADLIRSGMLSSRKTHIIDVCSLAGGSGKTATAICSGIRMAQKGKKVLYVNLEPFQHFYNLLNPDTTQRYMSDKLIHAIAINPHMAADYALEEMIHEQIDILPQLKGLTGTYQITFTSLLALIDEIAGRQIYDYIIAEFPEGLTSEMQMRLFSSETILITCMQNKDSAERINSFAEVMKTLSGQLYITCGRCEVNKENHINDVVHNLGFPVCEYVPQLDKYSIEALLERGCYKNTAAAIS
jgi:hypothetical protein